MTTTTSFSKQFQPKVFGHLYRELLRRYGSLTALYQVLLLLAVSLPCYVEAINYRSRAIKWAAEYAMDPGIGTYFPDVARVLLSLILLAAPVMLAAMMMHCLHDKRAVDFYHSLPVSRETWLAAHFAVGYTICTLPVLVAVLLGSLACPLVGHPWVDLMTLLQETGTLMLSVICMSFVIFSVATFVAVNTSTFVEAIGYSGALCSLTSVLPVIWHSLAGSLYGYIPHPGMRNLAQLSPYGTVLLAMDRAAAWDGDYGRYLLPQTVWVILAAALLVLAFWCYRRRHSEYAGQWGRSGWLGTIIKAFGGCLFAYLLYETLNISLTGVNDWLPVFSALVGGPLGYIIVEAITAKGFTTLRKQRRAIFASTALMTLAAVYVACGGFGYEQWGPSLDDVTSVEIETDLLETENAYIPESTIRNARTPEEAVNTTLEQPELVLDDSELIGQVIALHRQFLENNGTTRSDVGYITLTYHKTSGTARRRYTVSDREASQVMRLLRSAPAIEQTSPVFRITADHFTGITVSDTMGHTSSNTELDDSQRQQLLEALRQDMLEANVGLMDLYSNRELGTLELNMRGLVEVRDAGIQPLLQDPWVSIQLRQSYTRTLALLEQWGQSPRPADLSQVDTLILALPDPRSWYVTRCSTFLAEDTVSYTKENLQYAMNNDEQIIQHPELVKEILAHSVPAQSTVTGWKNVRIQAWEPAGYGVQKGEYLIDADQLLELMQTSDVFMPYLLSEKELDLVAQDRRENGRLITEENSNERAANESIFNEDLEGVSVAEYFRQRLPQLLEGRTSVQLEAMEKTPFAAYNGRIYYYEMWLGMNFGD